MSDLRNHLEAANREYQAARYPGDLARDAMPTIRASSRLRIFLRCASAIAAVIAIVLIGRITLRSTITPSTSRVIEPDNSAVATTTTDETSVSVSMTSVAAPSWSEVFSADSSDTTTVAENPSWPAMPSFPSMDQIDESTVGQTLNNQENE